MALKREEKSRWVPKLELLVLERRGSDWIPECPWSQGFPPARHRAKLTLPVTYLPPVHKELQLIRNLGWARHGSGEFGLLALIPATEVNRKD